MPITLAETLQLVFDLVKRAEEAEKRVQALEAQLADAQQRLEMLQGTRENAQCTALLF